MSKVNWFQSCSFIDPSTLVSFETKFQFNYPIEQVANGYLTLPQLNKVDPNTKKVKLVQINEETNTNYKSIVFSCEMTWGDQKSYKENVCAFAIDQNRLFFIKKPIQPKDGNWFKKDEEKKLHYFQHGIVILTKKTDSITSMQHILIINSKEKMEWEKKIIQRHYAFSTSLESSISKSPSKIEDLRETYEKKDENGVLEDALGNLLLGINFHSCQPLESSSEDDESCNSSTKVGDEDIFSVVENAF